MTSTSNRSNFAFGTLVRSGAAVALLAAAAVGCGSSPKSPASDISGAQSGAPSTSASPSPSASAAQPAGAPVVTLPADLTVDVAFPASGDQAKDAVAQGMTYALRAYNAAFAAGDGQAPAFQYAWDGMARPYMANIIQQLASRGQTITGATRYYAPTITVQDATHAAFTYCEDQSKGYPKDRATGKVLPSTPSIKDYTEWNTGLELSAKGVWRVTQAVGEKGSQRCQNA
ncbi:hypothetical protein ABT095_14765 [Kitasatospora sp. NPDC002227]|uniref:hypothetical protein n=1 Tax=Kitasatospora sp. NPDC002227 TaxID=3154773 RepID=UPI0033319B95